MAFESLLGNERIKQNLKAAAQKNRFAHFYLISGPNGSGKHTLARLLAATLMCESDHAPCGTCNACRKIMAGTHPDFLTVDDPEHKNVAVRIIREARESIFIRPNEGKRKIYLFPQEMGIEGQNALLKVLEEPPAYGVFLLLTDNPEKILPTVRSRCTELNLTALPDGILRAALQERFPEAAAEDLTAAMARSGGFLGQAIKILESGEAVSPQTVAFAESFASRDVLALTQLLVSMEKYKRDQLLETLAQWLEVLEAALADRSGMRAPTIQARELSMARSSQDLMDAIRSLKKASVYAAGNVSPAAVCGWLVWELRP